MELFAKLFGSLLVFVYHCFDRIVIHGYLSGLSRPEQVVYFFRDVVGVAVVNKEVLCRRTGDYQDWVEAFARNHETPDRVGREGRAQGRLRPALAALDGAAGPLRRLLHLQEHGARTDASGARSRSIRPRTRITGSWRRSAAASRTTTSTFGTRSWAPS